MHEVTQDWWGQAYGWSGPAYDGNALTFADFAYGWTNCPAQAWGQWSLPQSRAQAWVDNPGGFKGLTVRASTTDAVGWKRFRSQNYFEPSQRPRLEITYIAPIDVTQVAPVQDERVGSLTPVLWANPSANPDTETQFEVCMGENEGQLTGCQASGFQATSMWRVPAWSWRARSPTCPST